MDNNKSRSIFTPITVIKIFLVLLCLYFLVSFPEQYISKNYNPVKAVSSMNTNKVIASGEAIGVKIESQGVLIVGLSSIIDEKGNKLTPAADSGLEVGDIVISINNKKIDKEKDILDILKNVKNQEKLDVEIQRNTKTMSFKVIPVKSQSDQIFKIGLWVRDNIAGVGTMTFIDPISGRFGALGHGITDLDTGTLINLDKGVIIKSKISSIQKAKKSLPGELVGIFYENRDPYGYVTKNCEFGIYGEINLNKVNKDRLYELAPCSEIQEGPAKILATIDGSEVREFSIRVQRVNRQKFADGKSMVIEVTDPELLEKTGGIVQGMSGSPILQNNKIIGAVTHVLINNPTRGYGISSEWMLQQLQY